MTVQLVLVERRAGRTFVLAVMSVRSQTFSPCCPSIAVPVRSLA
jgi:hypothetical protein